MTPPDDPHHVPAPRQALGPRLAAASTPWPGYTGREPCRQRPAIFFPRTYDSARPEVRQARLACGRCPLRQPCLDWALANPALAATGIWGATTPTERETLRAVGATPQP